MHVNFPFLLFLLNQLVYYHQPCMDSGPGEKGGYRGIYPYWSEKLMLSQCISSLHLSHLDSSKGGSQHCFHMDMENYI